MLPRKTHLFRGEEEGFVDALEVHEPRRDDALHSAELQHGVLLADGGVIEDDVVDATAVLADRQVVAAAEAVRVSVWLACTLSALTVRQPHPVWHSLKVCTGRARGAHLP